jgi:hypothetical protein
MDTGTIANPTFQFFRTILALELFEVRYDVFAELVPCRIKALSRSVLFFISYLLFQHAELD